MVIYIQMDEARRIGLEMKPMQATLAKRAFKAFTEAIAAGETSDGVGITVSSQDALRRLVQLLEAAEVECECLADNVSLGDRVARTFPVT